MKKRLIHLTLMLVLFVCLFAVSVSAATALKPQTNNAYGDLSLFDESITVGRIDSKYGFTPYIDAEQTAYARVVIGDGTTFYTFPTAYVLSNTTIYGEGQINTYVSDISSLNTAMQNETGTNPNWTVDNIYRIELPYSVTRLNGGSVQAFQGYDNVIEIRLQPNSHVKDKNKTMIFWKCYNLETIHNLDTFTFRDGCLSGSFQECKKLKNLTIGYSPEVTTTSTNAFIGCIALESVNLFEAFPNLTTIGNFTFSGCTKLKTIYSATLKQEGAVFVKEGVTSIGQEAFYNCDSIKYLSLPSTITYLGPSIARSCGALQFVDFNENQNAIDLNNWGHFNDCDALKALSLPDGITIINNRFANDCANLEAVYLPANLEQMNTNANGQGPFCFDGKMYFVQQPFEVRNENGYFLGDSFVMPTKPNMYFMPSKLARAGGNVSSGTWFRDCASLNNIIVMPKAFTESTVVQMFRGIASSTQRKSVVYLGKITNYAWSEMNKYIDFVFANPGNTDLSTITFTSFYNRNNENCYFYFCSTGYRYTMAKADAAEVATTKVENSYCHIADPDVSDILNPTCVTPGYEQGSCFCGAPMGKKDLPATGKHTFVINNCIVSVKCNGDEACTEMSVPNAEHALVHTLVYANGFNNEGIYNCYCTNAGCTNVVDTNEDGIADAEIFDEKKDAIITFKGFSVPETAGVFGIDAGYGIDKNMLTLYETLNGEVKISLFMVNSADAASIGAILDSDLALVENVRGFSVELVSVNYTNISIRVKGFQKNDDLTGNYYTLNLITAMAVKTKDGIEYVQTNLKDDSTDNQAKIGELVFNTANANRVYTNTEG